MATKVIAHIRSEAEFNLQRFGSQSPSNPGSCLCARMSLDIVRTRVPAASEIELTRGATWTDYSLIECGSPQIPRLCLIFRTDPKSSDLQYAVSSDGVHFKLKPMSLFHDTSSLEQSPHAISSNIAFVRTTLEGHGEYLMLGGQGERGRFGRLGYVQPPAIHLMRGHGWPYHPSRYSIVHHVINSSYPTGCVDFRQSRIPWAQYASWARTGKPLAEPGCAFDGRLSVVVRQATRKPQLRLYMPAHFYEKRVAKGRFVQTTYSEDMGTTWKQWQGIQINGIAPFSVDIHHFHVQTNPVHNASLIAIYPITTPPYACIGLSFSLDGLEFSSPSQLFNSSIGWSTEDGDLQKQIEWRNEDHPVSGVVLRGDHVWFYIHRAVPRESLRTLGTPDNAETDREALVMRFSISVTELTQLYGHHLGTLNHTSADVGNTN
uniref:Sialidase domain-containing protein n=1 Tax=Chrysotila carterae TaxID=13221 RepID=A0A7S4B4K5_CHRCT